ncbi:PspC domain-containing protein [Leeuwenhoekiella parthenopeia]|uniref:PspC domain-containing protein n=1 Tax=Leeuwenhoekiella parthenopeia TaxID=2890320 RepID=A0ABS8GVI1_9FLAO|nr:PspC domain-containing protein [Leeuwenhoekiella parthenopeia]
MNNKKLTKSKDRMIAGVCSGIAEYLGWQTHHVRMLFLIGTLLGGSGLIIYTVLNFVMPNASNDYFQ